MNGYYNILYPYLHQTYATSFLLFTLCKKNRNENKPSLVYDKFFAIYIIKINRKVIQIDETFLQAAILYAGIVLSKTIYETAA